MLVDSAGAPVAEESAIAQLLSCCSMCCGVEVSSQGRQGKFLGDQSERRPNPKGTDGLGGARGLIMLR
jgi:hypothetical protein